MNKRILWWTIPLVILILIILFSIEESRVFLIAMILRVFFFVKKNILTILTAFFLIKGKFILTLFLKKIAILSATGLGKRYLIEKVITRNFKIHFLDHLTQDINRLARYIKKNFKTFPLIKQFLALLAFVGSLGFVGKFMGSMLAMKVFIAKIWSFLLALFLKVSTVIVYFFTDYLWGSWIAPIVEVVIFTWLLSWMEKVPFLAKGLRNMYAFFLSMYQWIEYYLENVLHLPVKSFLKWLAKYIQRYINSFIGYKKVSKWELLKQNRKLRNNAYTKLVKKRDSRRKILRTYISFHQTLLNKRKVRR